jgi:hypothetical protein
VAAARHCHQRHLVNLRAGICWRHANGQRGFR